MEIYSISSHHFQIHNFSMKVQNIICGLQSPLPHLLLEQLIYFKC